MNEHKNPSIHCTVEQCRHNLCDEHFCTLSCISVGTHEEDPSVPEWVDCTCFETSTGCC